MTQNKTALTHCVLKVALHFSVKGVTGLVVTLSWLELVDP
jgi:hypothetical protein